MLSLVIFEQNWKKLDWSSLKLMHVKLGLLKFFFFLKKGNMEKLSSFFKLSQMKWSEGGPLPLQRCGCASGSVQLKSPGCADFLLWRCCFLPGSTLAAHSGETGFLSCRSVWTDRTETNFYIQRHQKFLSWHVHFLCYTNTAHHQMSSL